MNYHKIQIYCDKYNINRYTPNGKPLTYNKLNNIVNDHTNKKHKYHKNKKIYNSIKQYLEDDFDDHELNNAMHHFIGN